MAHNLDEIEREAKELINKYVPHYHFEWSNRKTALGDCYYSQRRIRLSKFHALKNDRAVTTNTILHEIAHALAGVGTGHGKVWKQWCIKLGAKPERCAGIERTEHSWELHCSCMVHKYYRRPARKTVRYSVCSKCRGGLRLRKVT